MAPTLYRTFIGYLAGVTSKEEALKRLAVRELYNQYAFCSKKSLEYLIYSHMEEVD